MLRDKHISNHLKGDVCKVLGLSTFLHGFGVWCLRGDLINRLRSSHNRCVCSICRVSLYYAFHHHISSATPFQRLKIMDLDSYYNNRILRWAGHVARIPMTRALRLLLTGWIVNSRPNGFPKMARGWTLKSALKRKGLVVNFKEWRAIAEEKS